MYLKDCKDLELTVLEITVLTMAFNATDAGPGANEKNYMHIALKYAIKIVQDIRPDAFSKKGEKIRISLLEKLEKFAGK